MITAKSTILNRFQTTVPPSIRDIFGLDEGDILHWQFDRATKTLSITPMRASLITPKVMEAKERALNAKREGRTVPVAEAVLAEAEIED